MRFQEVAPSGAQLFLLSFDKSLPTVSATRPRTSLRIGFRVSIFTGMLL